MAWQVAVLLALAEPPQPLLLGFGRRHTGAMSTSNQLREFLTSRRAALSPEDVGLPGSLAPRPLPGYGGKRSPSWPA